MGKGNASGSIMDAIKTPLGAVLMLVITLILAGLAIASSISGNLTAAAVSAAGLVVIVLINEARTPSLGQLAMINLVGK